MTRLLALALLTLAVGSAAQPPAPPAIPGTPKRPVTDEYFGVKVTDEYRWLEDWSDPAVRAWSDAQNAAARDVLAGLPGLAAIRDRVRQLDGGGSAEYFGLVMRGGVLFALKEQPPKQQPLLVALKSPDDLASERVLLDPNAIDPSGSTRIDFFVPTLDGAKVAVSLSEHGTESGTVRVLETATPRELADRVPRVNGGTAGGSVAWNRDGSGFLYTRYPRGGERPAADLDFYQQVWFHRLGAAAGADTYEIGKEFPRIAETVLASSDDGRYALASVANGDGGQFAHFLRNGDGTWRRLTSFADGVVAAEFSADGGIYLLARKGSPRGRIVRVPVAAPEPARAAVVVPEGDAAIEGMLVTPGRLWVREVVGGPARLRVFKPGSGEAPAVVPLPAVSDVTGMARLTGDAVAYRVESFTEPAAWYTYAPTTGEAARTAMATTSPADFSGCEVVREAAVSKDGTKVPFSVIRRKGTKLDGSNPTLLTGYGGFGLSTAPRFSPADLAWLEQGGVLAVANLRGGGEFGEAWHRQGMLTRKQNVFDDLAACALRLVAAGYATPAKLAVEGGSNGGLLMGAMITQHPDLFRAVVAHVGLFDMLRFERFANGQFNVTEYGSVSNRAQFEALHAYSPYHHVADGTRYPACLFLTGANDPRVDPSNSRKMVARLQAASASGLPVLLRTSSGTGHIGTPLDERVAVRADVYAFLFRELGVAYAPVRAGKPGA